MRILITGAGGFAGRHLSVHLAEAGHEVLALNRRRPPAPGASRPFDVDIRDACTLAAAVESARPDACVHLAGMAFVPAGAAQPDLMLAINTAGTLNLLDAFRRQAPHARLLIVTSSQVYGTPETPVPLTEEAPLRPVTLYAVSKAAADLAALGYADHYGMPVLTARPVNHTGPGQSADFVIPSFARQLKAIAEGRGGDSLQVGNLESERYFADVRDVVRAYRLLIEKGRAGCAYNIGVGRATKIGDALDLLCRLGGVHPAIVQDPAKLRPTDRSPALDTTRLERDTGWQPRIALEDTLRDVWASA